MKKIIFALMLFTVILLTGSVEVLAQDNSFMTKEKSKTVQKVNEYQLYKSLNAKSNEELTKMGMSKDEIKQIKELDVKSELEKRSKLDDQSLKNLGYNNEQISMLRNFAGTEQQIMALSSDFYFEVFGDYATYDEYRSKTYYKVNFTWKWSIAPYIQYTDLIGAGWESDPLTFINLDKSFHTVTYKTTTGPVYSSVITYKFKTEHGTKNAEQAFPMKYGKTYPDYEYKIGTAMSGSGTIALDGDGMVNRIGLKIAYIHTNAVLSVQPSISVTYPLGMPGINFGISNKQEIVGYGPQNSPYYSLSTDGAFTGWISRNGNWYYFDYKGIMRSGWVSTSGKWYYFAENGVMKTGWQNISNKWYYFDASGAMQTGWLNLDGTWYYLESSGIMQTGWLNLNGTWYYLESSGAMKTGWLNLNGTWYYLESSGAMKTGWLNLNGTWYYLNSNGAMRTEPLTENGKTYYFSSSGACTNP